MYPLSADIYRIGNTVTSNVRTTTASYFSLGTYQQSSKINITQSTYSLGSTTSSIPGYSQGLGSFLNEFIDFGKPPLRSAVPSLSKLASTELRLITSETNQKLGQLYNTRIFHNFCVYSGLNAVYPPSVFSLFFGENAEQDINYIKIYKKDLPKFTLKNINTAESILTALHLRLLSCREDLNLNIAAHLYRLEVIPDKNLEKVWSVTEFFKLTEGIDDDTLNNNSINPMDY